MSIHFASTPQEELLAEQFAAAHPQGCFMQSPRWAQVKPQWGHTVLYSTGAAGDVRGSMLVLTLADRGDGKALLYAPRGPVCDFADGEALADLIKGARTLSTRFGGGVFKCDPLVLASDADTCARLTALGLDFVPGAGFHDTVQPRQNAVRHGLRGMTEEQIMAAFAAKTRYYVKQAFLHQVRCEAEGEAGLDDFYALYQETGARQQFAIRPKSYLAAILRAYGQDARLYISRAPDDGQPLAGAVAVAFGPRLNYVYGASSRARSELSGGYLMQWELLRFALERGCDIYDMGGICTDAADSPALYQLNAFKHKFAPLEEYAGEFTFAF